MDKYYTILTNIGKQKISNAILVNGKLNFFKMLIGDGGGSNYEPDVSQTSLKNQVYEADIISVTIDTNNDSYVVVQAIIPPEEGNFYIRELGLSDTEGNLIALAKFPETYKPVIENGSIKELVIKMILKVENSEVVNIVVNEELISGTITADNFSMYGITVVNKETGVTTLKITEDGKVYANITELKIGGSSINTLISNVISESKNYADEKYSKFEQTLEGFQFTAKDLKTAIVSITDDGIKVSMKEAEEELGYSLINSEGITVYDSDDNKLAWFGDNDSAYIKKLQAEDIICDNVVKIIPDDCPNNWFISMEATGDGTGRDSSNKSDSFNNVIKYIKNNYGVYLQNNKILNFYFEDGTYNEDINIRGFLGEGKININLTNETIIFGSYNFYDNIPVVRIIGSGTAAFGDGAILYATVDAMYIRNSHVYVEGMRSRQQDNLYNGTVGKSFAVCYDNAFITIKNCDIVGYNQLLYSAGSTYVWNGSAKLYNNCGWVTRVIYSHYGDVLIAGTYPKITKTDTNVASRITYLSGATQKNSEFLPAEETGSSDTPIPEQPTVPTNPKVLKTFKQSFTATKIYTTVEGSGSVTSTKTDKTGQGHWSKYKNHRGHAIIPNSLSSTLADAESWTINVKLHRWSTKHGQYGAIPIPKFVTTPNTTSVYSCKKAFALGDTYTVYVGDTLNTKIGKGTVKDLQFWSTSTSDYSFYDKVTFEVTYKKYV